MERGRGPRVYGVYEFEGGLRRVSQSGGTRFGAMGVPVGLRRWVEDLFSELRDGREGLYVCEGSVGCWWGCPPGPPRATQPLSCRGARGPVR